MKTKIYSNARQLSDYLQKPDSLVTQYCFWLFDSFKPNPGQIAGIYGKLRMDEQEYYKKEKQIERLLDLFRFKINSVSSLGGYVELILIPIDYKGNAYYPN
jgi:hypothetical protein